MRARRLAREVLFHRCVRVTQTNGKGKAVLKITVSNSSDEQKWSLQGRLTGQSVSTLRSAWRTAHNEADKRKCVVDLNDVTFVDRTGEAALAEMMSQGAEFLAVGLYTKELLRNLRGDSKRSLPMNGGEDDADSSR
jgi:ABC-type transporter Mla MlaB component